MDYPEALEFLQMANDFSLKELKSQYRKLISKNHPDKFTSCSDSTIEIQELISRKINTAYELLKKSLSGEGEQDSVNFTETPNPKIFHRKKVHPDHKNESFKDLWWAIREKQAAKNFPLTIELWSMSLLYLLNDFKKFPDIDGIIHNYIRDYSSLLIRLGLHDDAFILIRVAIINNVKSYYDFNIPTKVLYEAILKTRFLKPSIRIWKKLFLGKLIIKDISVQWAMIYTFYVNQEYTDIFENIENGNLVPLEDSKLLPSTIDTSTLVIGKVEGPLDNDCFDSDQMKIYKRHFRIKIPDIRKFKFGIVNILIKSRDNLNDPAFIDKYPISNKIINSYSQKELDKKAYKIPEKIPRFNGKLGKKKIFNRLISNDECRNEAVAIFNKFVLKKEQVQ